MRTCGLIMIMKFWTMSTANKCLWILEQDLVNTDVLRLQKNTLRKLFGVVFVMGTQAEHMIHLVNDFCRSRDVEKKKIVLHFLVTCSPLCLRRKSYLGAYCFLDFHKLLT